MATAAADPSPAPESRLQRAARALFVGLLWGGCMLLVLALWLGYKDPGAGIPWLAWVLGALGLCGLALAAWQGATLWSKTATPEQRETALAQQRRQIGAALLVGGVVLLIGALTLGLGRQTGADGGFGILWGSFGAAAGLLLFALFTLGTGFALLGPPAGDEAPAMAWLGQVIPLVKVSLPILGVILLGVFIWLTFFKDGAATRAPEEIALLLLGMLCFGAALWLFLAGPGAPDPFTLRLFVLVVGGATGLILLLMALGRAWLWRQDIFLGGIAAWQGPEAWKFWLVAYTQLLALGLMFVCLRLARADVRTSAELRRLLYGYNAVFGVLLVVEMLAVLNIIFFATVPYTFEWTRTRGAYALSNSSKSLLHELKRETHVYVLMPQDQLIYGDLRTLLSNAQAETGLLSVQYVAPDQDVYQYQRLSELFPKILPDARTSRGEETGWGVLLVYGEMPKDAKAKVPHAFVPLRKLFEIDHGQARGEPTKSVRIFKGEAEIMRELNFLVHNQQKRRVYVLQGYGTPDVNDIEPVSRRDMTQAFSETGVGELAGKLRKENYEVQGLSFGLKVPGAKSENLTYAEEGADKKKDVPKDAYALVIAGAVELPAEVVEAVERYMDRDGKLMVFLDVIVNDDYTALRKSGLEALLKRYGVEARDEFSLRFSERLDPRDDPRVVFGTAPRNPENPLAKQFFRNAVFMKRTARLLRADDRPGRFKIDELLVLDSRRLILNAQWYYTAEKAPAALRDPFGHLIQMAKDGTLAAHVGRGPEPVALAVTARGEGAKGKETPRLLVFGDADFITNQEITRSATREFNYSWVLSGLEWLSAREGLIGPLPKETSNVALPETANVSRMVFLPGWLMLLTLVGMGSCVWLVRRR